MVSGEGDDVVLHGGGAADVEEEEAEVEGEVDEEE